MKRRFLSVCLILASPILVVLLYLIAAGIGGVIPASFNSINEQQATLEKPVYLLANLLHTDIAIPINSLSLYEFDFLRKAGFPLDNPQLEYLVIGWGSEAFYTSTAEYSDIKFSTAWKAISGDNSVMHIAPAGNLAENDLIAINMPDESFAKLVAFIKSSFVMKEGRPVHLADKTFGFGDVFYQAKGNFNILNPCNQWVSEALKEAGFGTGVWTPTAYSFELGRRLYN